MKRTIRVMAVAVLITALWVTAASAGGGPPLNPMPGTPGNDVLRGTVHADYIPAGEGDDVAFGSGGDDQLLGEDDPYAAPGNDLLFGGSGDDGLYGGPGRDVLSGGRGDDFIEAADGERDVVSCGPGTDRYVVDEAFEEARDVVAGDCEIHWVLEG